MLGAVLAGTALGACGSPGHSSRTGSTAPAAGSGAPGRATAGPAGTLAARSLSWSLPAPVSRAVVLAQGGRLLVLGGLAPGDTSTSAVEEIDPTSGAVTSRGALAQAVHDAAGAVLGGQAYVFGGGAASSVDSVQAYPGGGGTASVVGHLPTARSDLAAATVGGTTYLVGGFTGSALPGAILATSDGTHFRVVGALIQPVRYPAVAADAQGRVWVAGGELGTTESALSGGQTDDIQRFDPSDGRTSLVGHLPEPVGHASGLFIGGSLFVVGGRHGSEASADVVRIDPASGQAMVAGALPAPRSDAGVAIVGSTAYLVGGEVSGPTAPLSSVVALSPAPGSSPAAAGAHPAPSGSTTVDVIYPASYNRVGYQVAGEDPRHLAPAWPRPIL